MIQHVVRRPGRWSLAPIPGDEPVDVEVGAVVAALGEDPPVRPTPGDGPTWDPATVVRGVWAWVGRVDRGVVVVTRHDGSLLELDRVDLALLDALDPEGSVAAVAAAASLTVVDVGRRFARLDGPVVVVSGRVPPPVEGGAGSGSLSSPSPSPSPSPVLATARAVGERSLRSAARVARHLGRHLDHRVERRRAPGVQPEVGEHHTADEVPVPDGRVPVYAIWHDAVGPSLSLGMLTAAARHHRGGELTERFDIRRPERASSFLDDLARRRGPAVLLCSNYVWSLADNLAAAAAGVALNPELMVIHGGPSSPKYTDDARRFLDDHREVAHLLVRGEGEEVLCAVLDALAAGGVRVDPQALSRIGGLTFLDPGSGEFVRTPDQDRIVDLDVLPSPYLTGEFDDIPGDAWQHCLSIETNRGCPYGCTFCDWGSSTLARIRHFDLDRVRSEIEWVASRGIQTLNIADANFGIRSRDVDIARALGTAKRRWGAPLLVGYYPAKNTTKHLAPIMDALLDAEIGTSATISLQSTDAATLDAVERSNISTDHYVALAAEMRRRRLPLQGDLLIGLPGQRLESYKGDLQFHLDHEIDARTWQVRVLPNAPMNAPEYRRRYALEVDESHRVMAASTFTSTERADMLRLRTASTIAERYGLLRHVLRYVQWEHGIEALDVVARIARCAVDEPERYPTLSWVFTYFDLVPTTAVGWPSFFADVAAMLSTEFGVADGPLGTVLALQEFLMPSPGRRFPAHIDLDHDYPGWYHDATEELHRSGRATSPVDRLADRPPVRFTVSGDPLHLCERGMEIGGDPRDPLFENDFAIGANSAYELASPLMRLLPHVAFVAPDAYRSVVPERERYEPTPRRRIEVVAAPSAAAVADEDS